MIRVAGISKDFHLGETIVHAVSNASFEIAAGEFAALAGPSGSGKSTLLNLIGIIESPTAGNIFINNQNISLLTAEDSASLRLEKLGFIFQTFNLLPVLTARENVEYPLALRRIPKDQREKRVRDALQSVGMGSFADHKPSQLSGGQRQRVAIARALVGKPPIILADEPTANLDQATGEEIIALLKTLHEHSGATVLFSTHDPRIIKLADHVLHLESGRVIGI